MGKVLLLKWMDAFCRQKGAEHDFDERGRLPHMAIVPTIAKNDAGSKG
jgi:hypothetical protein